MEDNNNVVNNIKSSVSVQSILKINEPIKWSKISEPIKSSKISEPIKSSKIMRIDCTETLDLILLTTLLYPPLDS